MNKTIYDEAIKVVTYLREQNSHLKDNCGTIYVSTENIATLENLLIHSHKQEKLLELYKEINNKRKELITLARYNTWSWELDIEIKDIQDKIKEKEND